VKRGLQASASAGSLPDVGSPSALKFQILGSWMAARGLKTKIAINITVFLLVGMVSIDLVTMLTAQRSLVKSELARGQSLVRILREYLPHDGRLEDSLGKGRTPERLRTAISEAGISCFLLLARDVQHFGFGTPACAVDPDILHQTERALSGGSEIVNLSGSTFGLIWQQPERVVISSPVWTADDTETPAAFSIVLPLEPAYRTLRRTHYSLMLYIGVNTAVLAFLGIYRVIKLYLQPLGRLAKRAEDYKEDDELLFSVRKEDNELLRLSSALNAMMRRLAAERTKLRESVRSLETVNRELKKAQDDIVRAEKLTLVGRLSAGIAHEIGNPLGIVTGYLALLKQPAVPETERAEFLMRAEAEVERISAIIRQLLQIARPSPGGPRPVSVAQVLSDLEQTLAVQPFMSRVRLVTRLAAESDIVRADPDRLRQVFLNLAINAADAVVARHPISGGQLIIATAEAGVPDGNPDSGRWLEVRFEDNGDGIPPEVLPFIFDPFCTTKEPGKGTGLGLSVSVMIVQGFGGVLQAESTPGQGTIMSVRLPLERAAPDARFVTDPAGATTPARHDPPRPLLEIA
jgi:signal transduction histidine kinase